MSLDTTSLAWPLPPDALLAASVGEELILGRRVPDPDPDAPTWDDLVGQVWEALAGQRSALPTWEICGTDRPGAVMFNLPAPGAWRDMYADLLGPPLAGEPGLGLDVSRTATGARLCVHAPEGAGCDGAALDGSAFCYLHGENAPEPAPTN